MPYLPAKDELVSLNHSSSQGLWKWYNSKVLAIFNKQWLHPSFLKKIFYRNFDFDFRKCFTEGFFLTEYEEFQNFSFDGKFLIVQTAAQGY